MVHEGAHVGLRNDLSVEAMKGRDRLHSPDSTVFSRSAITTSTREAGAQAREKHVNRAL